MNKKSSPLDIRHYRVPTRGKLHLKEWPTHIDAGSESEEAAEEALATQVERTSELQDVLYADNRHSLLLIFQAMDAAGKDGAIKHVMSGVNPVGCQVASFKQPSAEELDHDFLWRAARQTPERGRIGIFNRSYYEEVLVVRVHPELLDKQGLPLSCLDPKKIWKQRFESIVDFEKHLARSGTQVVKFYLHVSKEEQRQRFLDRIDHPAKNWKFAMGDVEERGHWSAYRDAYEDCLAATSTAAAPWYVIPADDKRTARLLISRVINETLEHMDLEYPKIDGPRLQELKSARKLLVK